jgi:CHAD domain-containing protein
MGKKQRRWDASKTAAENAAAVLPALTERLFERGRKAVESVDAADSLHGFRLRVKRYRYTLELFRPCYGPGMEKRLNQLKQLQDRLGVINDCAIAESLAERHDPATWPGEPEFLRFLADRAEELAREFRAFWRESFDAPAEFQSWTRYFRYYAGRNHSRAAQLPKAPNALAAVSNPSQ